ncbi:terminase small subunit [Mesorhizobium sp. M1338]|uniref:terminase small subunit n=1 Tax=unclassified Mesorhizobium TaxID=325217 RepID=UPI00333A475D
MPKSKLNIRHERFCHALAEGLPQSRAYIEAGYAARGNAAEVEASKLVRMPKVAARVAELQAEAAIRSDVTVDGLVEELEQARIGAMAARQYSAAAGAILGKAKLLGLITDKAEIETAVRRPMREPGAVRQMSLQEWEERFRPKTSATQLGNGKPAAEPEKTEPEEEIGIIETIRRAKAAIQAKSGST